MKTDFDLCTESHALRDALWMSRCSPDFWRLLRECDPRVSLQPPATEDQLARLREYIGSNLPEDVEDFLRQSNGLRFHADYIVFSADEMIEQTEFMRRLASEGWHMPLDHFLFIGAAGDGDMFACGRCISGEWAPFVYWWEHETDSRYFCGIGIYGYVAAHVAWWHAGPPPPVA